MPETNLVMANPIITEMAIARNSKGVIYFILRIVFIIYDTCVMIAFLP